MPIRQCTYCEKSFSSNEQRKIHEEKCVENDKTKEERFKARIKKS